MVFHDVTSFATHVINCASHLRILDLKGEHAIISIKVIKAMQPEIHDKANYSYTGCTIHDILNVLVYAPCITLITHIEL